jgi:hypothetical protein
LVTHFLATLPERPSQAFHNLLCVALLSDFEGKQASSSTPGVILHYTIKRHREALLWSHIMLRSDVENYGYLSWPERQRILPDIAEGVNNEPPELFRHHIHYRVGESLAAAGLDPP